MNKRPHIDLTKLAPVSWTAALVRDGNDAKLRVVKLIDDAERKAAQWKAAGCGAPGCAEKWMLLEEGY